MASLAGRVDRIGFSPTLAVNDLARRLRAEGVDVLDFSAGQPDFDTPEPVKVAGVRAIEQNRTRYTANAGLPELREAISAHLSADRGLAYGADQILVSPGAKASLYFAFMALLDPGDEVLVPSPYWTSYPEQVRLAGGEPVFVPCPEAGGFRLTVEALETAVTPRTKALVLNYPSNPTGASYPGERLAEIAEFCARHDLWVVADEIYGKLLYDGLAFKSIAAVADGKIRERTLIIDGMSKTYAMTGWRIGYAAGPGPWVAAMAKIQSHSTSNATSISQWASVAALDGGSDAELRRRVLEFQGRRDEILGLLEALPAVSCVRPDGAFYAFPNISGYLGRADPGGPATAEQLARYLLEKARVAVVPGEAFGSPEHLRLSYAVSLDRIREGMERIAAALEELGAAA